MTLLAISRVRKGGVLVLLLAACGVTSGLRAETELVFVERLLATLVTTVEDDGHLSQDSLEHETNLPGKESGGLQECVFRDYGLRSLWIRDAASDNVSISVSLEDGVPKKAGAAEAGDLTVPNREAVFALGKWISLLQVPGTVRCAVDTKAGKPESSVLLGFRNPASGSRVIVMFGISEEGLRDAESAKPGDEPEIVAWVLVVNQLEIPCVPLPE